MSTALKDIYSKDFYSKFSKILKEEIPNFNEKKFTQLIFTNDWKEKELKDRMKHTADVLAHFLNPNFEKACKEIEKIIKKCRTNKITQSGFEFMFIPDYIEKNGINHFDASVKCMEFVTQFTSCEFAVRPFILKYKEKMLKQMHSWSKHQSEHVRRLASEGSRPRLPWAMAIPELKKNPTPILKIIENLKNDPSEYVRRSVANNLNDISKDNPEVLISIAKKWKGLGSGTDYIIKHASRTLLKQGHTEILKYYGLKDSSKIILTDLFLDNKKIKVGDYLHFSFKLQNKEKAKTYIRLEYAIYYLRMNGEYSKKVFKISERDYAKDESLIIKRKQSFKIITTRKFYEGEHKISIIMNGQEKMISNFTLSYNP